MINNNYEEKPIGRLIKKKKPGTQNPITTQQCAQPNQLPLAANDVSAVDVINTKIDNLLDANKSTEQSFTVASVQDLEG
jgi:hypothetical protein